MRRICSAAAIFICLLLVMAWQGCGGEEDGSVDVGERAESVTAYQAVQFSADAADKWQEENWVIQVRDGGPEGLLKDGTSSVWEVYYFSPRPEENNQMLVIYNRGNVWPNTPGRNRGGDRGREIYRENRPEDFRVDSGEAYTVAMRNGGGEFLESNPEARVNVALRCKADYDAVDDSMPARYKWIWEVTFRNVETGSGLLEILVDAMNGDFITVSRDEPSG